MHIPFLDLSTPEKIDDDSDGVDAQYFTWHLMDRRCRSSVEPGFRGASQPSWRAGARSATGRGEG